ncbi:MAG: phosphate signaling complex protein PhoU [Cellulosilyticum sp.]|nr:phosphate signaling complex protein PhoU [Cellulosilyticum sp.]
MRNGFDKQLDELNNNMMLMGTLIEQAIELAIGALVNRDMDKAKQAIAFDDQIDEQEKKIERLCLKLLLQQQPVAKDLRIISSALKMITDMERIGDHASDISEITLVLDKEGEVTLLTSIREMAKETTQMVIKSVEAFVARDIELARNVIKQDDKVDTLFTELKSEIIRLINKSEEDGELATDLLMIGKYFERIGDHATNIAEWVIFSITGQH